MQRDVPVTKRGQKEKSKMSSSERSGSHAPREVLRSWCLDMTGDELRCQDFSRKKEALLLVMQDEAKKHTVDDWLDDIAREPDPSKRAVRALRAYRFLLRRKPHSTRVSWKFGGHQW